jgi:hypothetical protein
MASYLLILSTSFLFSLFALRYVARRSPEPSEGAKAAAPCAMLFAQCTRVLEPFDKPFDKLTVLSKVERLTALNNVEGPLNPNIYPLEKNRRNRMKLKIPG